MSDESWRELWRRVGETGDPALAELLARTLRRLAPPDERRFPWAKPDMTLREVTNHFTEYDKQNFGGSNKKGALRPTWTRLCSRSHYWWSSSQQAARDALATLREIVGLDLRHIAGVGPKAEQLARELAYSVGLELGVPSLHGLPGMGDWIDVPGPPQPRSAETF